MGSNTVKAGRTNIKNFLQTVHLTVDILNAIISQFMNDNEKSLGEVDVRRRILLRDSYGYLTLTKERQLMPLN